MPPPSSSLQWLSLVGIIWLQAISGTNSDFPVYSSQLKDLLSITQVQLNNLAFASDAGKLLGWFSGLATVYLPLWVVLMIGAVLGLIGYGVQFLFLVSKITSLSYWQVFLLSFLGGNAICWINTVCYMVSIQNFPSNSRVAVGLSTSYVGLSAKVYTILADAIFHPLPNKKAKAYLFLNAVAPLVVATVTAPFIREIKSGDETRSDTRFMVIIIIALATGTYAVVSSVVSVSSGPTPTTHMVSLGALLAAPLIVPLVVKFREGVGEKWCVREEKRVHDQTVDEAAGQVELKGTNRVAVEEAEEELSGDEGEVGVGLMVRKVEFWLYFFGYMFGATVGLVFLNNLGQIAESRGLSRTSSLVSLSSSFGFFGRFLPSLLDHFFSRYMLPSPALTAVLMGPMAGAFFLLLNSSNLSLFISTAIIGACSGAIASISVSTTSELFGRKHFGVNHNVAIANIPKGSFLFGYFAALEYQRGAAAGGAAATAARRCLGAKCYGKTFVLWGSLCSIGTLLFLSLRANSSQVGVPGERERGLHHIK